MESILPLVRKAARTAEHTGKLNRCSKSISDYEVMNQAIKAFLPTILFPVPVTTETDIAYQDSFFKIDDDAILG